MTELILSSEIVAWFKVRIRTARYDIYSRKKRKENVLFCDYQSVSVQSKMFCLQPE